MMQVNDLISIITPLYNGERYIEQTIKSVLAQTYENWEMVIVDDLSTDRSVELIKGYVQKDKRIRFYTLSEKGGASIARNKARLEAKGDYIAFLDSDDVWKPNKLEKQLAFMREKDIDFSYHNYSLIDENGESLHIRRIAPAELSYKRALLGCSIGCLSVMYNAKRVGVIQIEKIDKRNDDALWFKILNICQKGYLLDKDLANYRIVNSSLSSGSKLRLLKYHYLLYRTSVKFGYIKSMLYTVANIFVYFSNKRKREIRF